MIRSRLPRPATSPSPRTLPLSPFSYTNPPILCLLPFPTSPTPTHPTQLDTPVPPQPLCFQSNPHTFRHTWGCPSVSTFNFALSTPRRPLRTCPRQRPHQCHSASFRRPLFSYSYALYCTKQNAISHLFNFLRTLSNNLPGWGTHPSVHPFIRSPFRRNFLLARSTAVVTRGPREQASTSQNTRRSTQIPTSPNMLKWTCTQGATRFRRKLSRPEGMPGPTCP
jgi:hypothetical protein